MFNGRILICATIAAVLCSFGLKCFGIESTPLGQIDARTNMYTAADIDNMHFPSDIDIDPHTVTIKNDDATKDRRVQIGAKAVASGDSGEQSNNNRYHAVAVGDEAGAFGAASVAVGSHAIAGGTNGANFGVAIGYRAIAFEHSSIAIGSSNNTGQEIDTTLPDGTVTNIKGIAIARAKGAVQIGPGTNTDQNSLKFRDTTIVDSSGKIPMPNNMVTSATTTYNPYNIAIGAGAYALPSGRNAQVVIGSNAVSRASNSIAIGAGANVSRGYGTAIGTFSDAGGTYSVALGHKAVVTNEFTGQTVTRAIQLGEGTNRTSNTLQFQNTIVMSNEWLNVDAIPIDNETIMKENGKLISSVHNIGSRNVLLGPLNEAEFDDVDFWNSELGNYINLVTLNRPMLGSRLEYKTNSLGRVFGAYLTYATNEMSKLIKPVDKITDGTNTITATRDVYEWTQTGYTDWVPTIQEVVQGEYVYKPVNYAPPKYFGTAEELFEDEYYSPYFSSVGWHGPGWYYVYEIDQNGEYFTTAGDYCSAPSNALELASSYFGYVRGYEYETVNRGRLALTNDYPKFASTNLVDVRDIDQDSDGLEDRRVAIGANADASGHIENDGSNHNHYQSVAIGNEAKAKSPTSVAIGPWARTGDASPSSFGVAIGYRAYAPNQASVAIGSGVRADGDETDNAYVDEDGESQSAYAIAAAKGAVQIGAGKNTETNSLQFRSVKLITNDGRLLSSKTNIVIGIGARADVNNEYVRTNITGKASTYYGIAIGAEATSDVSQESVTLNVGEVSGIAIGRKAKTTKRQGVALGSGSSARGSSSVAVGYNASVGTDSAVANNAIAIGPSSGATADNGISIGNGAKAKATRSIAIGNSAIVESGKTDSVQLGAGTCTEARALRFLNTTLAYGTADPDGVEIRPAVLPDATTSSKGAVTIDKMWDTSGWANNKAADAGVVSNKMQELRASIPMAQTNTYAMFIIPIEDSSNWPDIELKASTNNFDSVYGQAASYCYIMHSGFQWIPEPGQAYDDKLMFATGNPRRENGIDARKWDKITYTGEIDAPPYKSLVVIVSPECMTRYGPHKDSSWLHDKNEEVVWSYIRCGVEVGREKDGSDTELWHPITPIRWFSKLPSWANQ